MMSIVRDRLMAVREETDPKEALRGIISDANSGGEMTDESRRLIVSVYKGRKGPFYIDHRDLAKAHRMVEAGWPEESASPRRRSTKPKKKVPQRPDTDGFERPDRRGGRDVTGDDFIRDFGFYGVEFGNWVHAGERQELVNAAYDSLCDLADVLDVPRESISLGGTLSLAFGARGSGKASAHYETGRRVINLTRSRGIGSLAHEWAHALDHYCGTVGMPNSDAGVQGGSGWYTHYQTPGARLIGLDSDEASAWDTLMNGLRNSPIGRAEVLQAVQDQIDKIDEGIERYRRIEQEQPRGPSVAAAAGREVSRLQKSRDAKVARQKAIEAADDTTDFGRRQTDFLNEAVNLSGKNGYYTRPTELFARVFEYYVNDTLVERGACNTFLVHGVEHERFADPDLKGNPYPGGEERERMIELVGDLVSAMQPRLIREVESVQDQQASLSL